MPSKGLVRAEARIAACTTARVCRMKCPPGPLGSDGGGDLLHGQAEDGLLRLGVIDAVRIDNKRPWHERDPSDFHA
jgi:hypothetical protein